MPANIVDVDTFSDPVTTPAGTDPANAASVLDPVQKLANRTRHLLNRHAYGGLRASSNIVMSSAPVTGLTVLPWGADLPHSDDYSPVSNALDVPRDGDYLLVASLTVAVSTNETLGFNWRVNGATAPSGPAADIALAANDWGTVTMTGILTLSGGDSVALWTFPWANPTDITVRAGSSILMRAL